MSKSTTRRALAKIAARLEAEMDRIRPMASLRDAQDVSLGLLELLAACHDTLDALDEIGGRATRRDIADAVLAVRMDGLMDELAASLPPVRGGGPDDFEDVDPEFTADPAGWPSWTDADRWEPNYGGPTPLEVLAKSAPTWEPSEADWADYLATGSSLSEADHIILHGCC